MIFATLPTGPLEVNCYIIGCEKTMKAAVIDPGGNADRILQRLSALKLQTVMIINTHGHFDHIGGNGDLLKATGAELIIHRDDSILLERAGEHAAAFGLRAEPSPAPTRLLNGDETLQLGELTLQVIHTPGHSPGGVCLYVDDYLFVGDTLFAGSIGRTDLPGGHHQLLIAGIKEKLLPLPENTKVYPGHGPMTTIGEEKLHNPFLS
ncbi:MBL fold metallo-hydrolase [uncultured Desulfuromusa sp.]|uniref:MBL fold metallo-hydrolase n=1 Tax=uncultured Desulfuromusa sp. TaxID=219183 RepID=UPI002AA64C44|nr:MBL fold metallo-hydrolase [uncultured Desulfuromusa sp.]